MRDWIKECPSEDLRLILASLVVMRGVPETSTLKKLTVSNEEDLEVFSLEIIEELTTRKSESAKLLEQLIKNQEMFDDEKQ